MVRLTILLAVIIYCVLLLIPGEDHTVSEEASTTADGFVASVVEQAAENASSPPGEPITLVGRVDRLAETNALVENEDGFLLQMPDGEWVEVAAIIDPADLMGTDEESDDGVARVDVAADTAPEIDDTASNEEPEPRLLRVTGTVVNVRAGPSTNDSILTALRQGEEVEFIGIEAEDWTHLRIPSTGEEGYMATQFLEPVE